MALNIFHCYANDNNLGDVGSAEGIKYLIREHIDTQAAFEDFFIAYQDFDSATIARVNRDFDCVVVGGGGLYWPYAKKTLLRLSYRALKGIKKPIFLYGVGLNYEAKDEKRYKRMMKKIQHLHDYVTLSSVRDVMSQMELASKGIPTDLVPCPSMFLSPIPFELAFTEKKKIGFVLVPLSRLSTLAAQNYIRTLVATISVLHTEYACYLIAHTKQVTDSYLSLRQRVDIPLLFSSSAQQLMGAYSQMDYLVGSRGHMGIFALGAGKPFLNISYNIKCDAFVDMVGYPSLFSVALQDITPEVLLSLFAELQGDENTVRTLLSKKRAEYLEKNIYFLKKMSQLIT